MTNSFDRAKKLLSAAVILPGKSRKRKNKQVNAMVDDLTGIGSAGYYAYVFEYFIKSERGIYYAAYISLDGGKTMLNGRELDRVQKYAARKLAELTRQNEYIFRVAEGCFVMLIRGEGQDAAKARLDDILRELSDYLGDIQGEYAKLFCAGLCSLADNPDLDADGILDCARQGYLYAVRRGLTCVFSSPDILRSMNEEELLRRSIAKAIQNREFAMYLQFIVERETEKICGAEVLSRWDSREFGLMQPYKYIGIMRKTGAVTAHDYSIFDRLCALLESWSGTEYGGLFLDCNFTRLSVSEEDFADKIKEISEKYDFDHSKLVIEVTEDSLIENSVLASENLAKCKELGFKTAIDDMGSGYSAIADLYASEIDLVKIDRELVIEGVTEKGRRLLDGIISLAHNMGAKALCEGIETDEQRAMILSTDCDYIQGYAYSRPLPLDEAMEKYSG